MHKFSCIAAAKHCNEAQLQLHCTGTLTALVCYYSKLIGIDLNSRICCIEFLPYLRSRDVHILLDYMHINQVVERWHAHKFSLRSMATPAIPTMIVRNQQNRWILLNIALISDLTIIAQTDKLLSFLQSNVKFGCLLESRTNSLKIMLCLLTADDYYHLEKTIFQSGHDSRKWAATASEHGYSNLSSEHGYSK